MALELKAKRTGKITKLYYPWRCGAIHETTLLSYEQIRGQLPLVMDAWEALNI